MADSTVKIYGFVNDTAFCNRDFDVSSKTDQIDQGACCYTDSISKMMYTPEFIRDTRTNRVTMPELVLVGSSWTESDPVPGSTRTLKQVISSEHTRMNGRMSIVYDGSKLTNEVKDTFKQTNQMNALFSFIEIMGHYQTFASDSDRIGPDLAIPEAVAAQYKVAAGNVVVNQELSIESRFVPIAKTCGVNVEEETGTLEFKMNRKVRSSLVLEYVGKTTDNKEIPIQLHLWFSRDKFVEEYPLSTITDVIFPCKPECLYELLDNYKSVSAASSAISEYSSTEMNKIVAKNDHTGVYTFTTDYYAYPDTQPNNTFKLSFSCVYKGHVPTLDEVKSRLRSEVLAIMPLHSEAEWKKKLPGLIADRQFFLIPIYDNIWKATDTTTGDVTTYRWGIYDLTILSKLIRNVLGATYLNYEKYAQIVAPRYAKYPTLCVPNEGNPSTSMLISELYPDYIGRKSGEQEDETVVTNAEPPQNPNTISFETLFNDALSTAAGTDLTKFHEITGFPGLYWVNFSPSDGTEYNVLAKISYPVIR